MTQFVRPISTISAGNWSPVGAGTLHGALGTVSADDATYGSIAGNQSGSMQLGLSEADSPDPGTRTIRYRYRKDASGGNSRDLTVILYQGATIVQAWTHTDISNAWVTATATVTGTITDWSTLSIDFNAGGATGGSPANRREVHVSWMELEVPANTAVLYEETVTDPLGAVDSASTLLAISHVEAPGDTLDLTDAASRVVTVERSVGDSVSLADEVSFDLWNPFAGKWGENAAWGLGTHSWDGAPTGVDYVENVSDTLGLSDTAALSREIVVTVVDGLGGLDSTGRAAPAARTFADAVGGLDSATVARVLARAIDDVAGLTDTATRVGVFARSVGDSLGLSDTVVSAILSGLLEVAADTVSLSDTVTLLATWSRSVVDSLALSDTATRAGASTRAVADVAGLTDTTGTALGLGRSVVDGAGLSDTATRVGAFGRAVGDSLGLSDTTAQAVASARALSDTAALTDQVSPARAIVVTVTDPLGVLDPVLIDFQTGFELEFFDTVGVSDVQWATTSRVRNVPVASVALEPYPQARVLVASRPAAKVAWVPTPQAFVSQEDE